MKREILYRGKRVDNGEWVCGFYFIDLENGLPYIMLKERRETVEDWMIKSVRVLPETVGQFTGLTDKNGVKIFEGDLVKTNGKGKNYMANKFYTVEFIDGAFCITAKVVKTGCDFSITIRDAMFKAKHYGETLEMEVIGNIHDNPELLHP